MIQTINKKVVIGKDLIVTINKVEVPNILPTSTPSPIITPSPTDVPSELPQSVQPTPTPISIIIPSPTATPFLSSGNGSGSISNSTPNIQVSATVNPDSIGVK